MRKLTLAAALGGVLAVSALAMPAFAQSESYDPANTTGGPYAHGYTYSYGYTSYPSGGYTYMTNPAPAQVTTYTTPTYVAPTYVAPMPQASTTTTYTTQPYGQTTTTYTTTSPVVTYAPVYQPSVATTVYVAPRACNPYDVTRPGVTTGCD